MYHNLQLFYFVILTENFELLKNSFMKDHSATAISPVGQTQMMVISDPITLKMDKIC
jgi:hypothetical protein